MNGKIVGFFDDNIEIEYEDGTRANKSVAHVITPPAPMGRMVNAPPETVANGPTAEMGTVFTFKKDNVLPEHTHDAMSLHTIEVLSGKMLVKKTSGDVTLDAGGFATLAVGEKHSIVALEDGRTLHVIPAHVSA
jgi:quercetin dioxygenase-like cupin family protein